MSSELIAKAIQWAKTPYTNNSEETLKNIISRWPTGVSPSRLVDKSSWFGEGKLGHIAKDTDENLYQLLREVHHGSPKGIELDPTGKWRKVGMGIAAAGGIPGVGVYSNMSRIGTTIVKDTVGAALDHYVLDPPEFRGRSCLGTAGAGWHWDPTARKRVRGWCGGKRRTTRREKRSNRTKKSRRY
jgi:hypothetical protein